MKAGDIIKKLRIENKYTQTELAEKLGIKLSTLQKYENSTIENFKVVTIRKLCAESGNKQTKILKQRSFPLLFLVYCR